MGRNEETMKIISAVISQDFRPSSLHSSKIDLASRIVTLGWDWSESLLKKRKRFKADKLALRLQRHI
jgi:hypothetical protein